MWSSMSMTTSSFEEVRGFLQADEWKNWMDYYEFVTGEKEDGDEWDDYIFALLCCDHGMDGGNLTWNLSIFAG